MTARKGPAWTSTITSVLRRLLTPLAGSGRGLFGSVALLLLLTVGGYVGWAKWGSVLGRQPQYVLTVDCFDITPQPPWIHADIRTAVMRDGNLAELSVLDPDFTKRVVQAFETNAWVAEALWAGKRPGIDAPRVTVKLRYREPVIMVRTHDPRWDGDCFWPVDTEGVFLPPQEFSATQTKTFLRVEAGDSLPAGAVGTAYGDAGVAGAALVAFALRDVWRAVGLEWIVVRQELPPDVAQPVEPTFILLPVGAPVDAVAARRSTRLISLADPPSNAPSLEVRWGHAPGREAPGEASAAEKVARLQLYAQENGRLDQLAPTTIVDLRPAAGTSVGDAEARLQPLK